MKFIDSYIKNLAPETTWFEKIESSGLGIRVMPSGNKSWFYRFSMNGKRQKMTLGKYPAISLKQAREYLAKAQSLKEQGINPIENTKLEKLKEDNTFSKLIQSWYENYAVKNRKQPRPIKYQIDSEIIPLLGDTVLDKLQTKDITIALDKIVQRGAPIHANRILSTIKQVLNYAVSRGYIQYNPATNIRSRDIGGIEKPRERVLSPEEIRIIWKFLESDKSQMSESARLAIKVIILTGVRTGEIRLAQWHQFDFEQSLWTIPPEHSKGGITVKIHLSELTKKLLLQFKEQSTSPFVIPGITIDVPMSKDALPRAIKRIQNRVGIPEWTAHDLRRTFATQLGESLNIDPVVIEKCLGHKMPRIMATYNKNEMLPQRKEALDAWASHIERLISSKD
ncbi:TPA: tyrosine-type recombinase/integrase [Legionella pneumophila]|uniref:tyrosine-type recombinase/integrase n=1 Tax=Legionella septentrionalis TaxID=2498109 RepID=UPI000F8F528F|nr:site-specific integrase [Legionella septentrionalis]HAT8371162.1 tyrosine-type recombinase/integrase [Legionella pneumophila]RUR12827.1 site-specific integrase [Legionella septentrionalis]HCC0378690.1 tyrosine-type recombinase/integrase [Legionella pneumophila]HEJ6634845.1 tyrosine-type recombinase/integrase [Legionella pneumophila]HEK3834938.1 tyrosine-type recombinase/integrase [Legionella pneumophila]